VRVQHAVIEGQHQTGLGIGALPGSTLSKHPTDEHDLGVSWQNSRETVYPPAPTLAPEAATAPRPYFSQYPSTSQASLDSNHSDGDTPPETDGERLTFAPPQPGSAHRRVPSRAYDEQGNPRAASMGARVAGAVSRNPTFRHVSRTLRKASVRVVNIMGAEDARGRVKLNDEGEEGHDGKDVDEDVPMGLVQEPEGSGGETRPEPKPPEGRLRGRTLGVFGPYSPTRKAMDALLRFPWVGATVRGCVRLTADGRNRSS